VHNSSFGHFPDPGNTLTRSRRPETTLRPLFEREFRSAIDRQSLKHEGKAASRRSSSRHSTRSVYPSATRPGHWPWTLY